MYFTAHQLTFYKIIQLVKKSEPFQNFSNRVITTYFTLLLLVIFICFTTSLAKEITC